MHYNDLAVTRHREKWGQYCFLYNIFLQTIDAQEMMETRLKRLKMETTVIEQHNERLESNKETASKKSAAEVNGDSEVRGAQSARRCHTNYNYCIFCSFLLGEGGGGALKKKKKVFSLVIFQLSQIPTHCRECAQYQ